MCGFPATKKNKLKRHMETVHRDEDFNVTSVISQQHKRKNLGVEKKISINILKINFMHFYWCDWLMCLNHCKQNKLVFLTFQKSEAKLKKQRILTFRPKSEE